MKNGDIAVIQNVDRVAKVFCVGLQWGGLDAGDKNAAALIFAGSVNNEGVSLDSADIVVAEIV